MADRSERQRVLKEVGLTSTTFIGPAFPPTKATVENRAFPPPTAPVEKSDIEDSLSEFYKELEEIDTPDGATEDNPGRQYELQIPARESLVSMVVETDGYQRSEQKRLSSRPHWYQNEPYYLRRPHPGPNLSFVRPAPPIQNQWGYPHMSKRPLNPGFNRPPNSEFDRQQNSGFNRPPNPGFHRLPNPEFNIPQNPGFNRPPNSDFNRPPNPGCPRPPFAHHPPPPSIYTNPQNPPPPKSQYRDLSPFPTFPSFPPLNLPTHPSQGFRGNSPQYFDRDERLSTHGKTQNLDIDERLSINNAQHLDMDERLDTVNTQHFERDKRPSSYETQHLDQDERLSAYDTGSNANVERSGDCDWRRKKDSESGLWKHHHSQTQTNNSSLVLILMRGLPGSGKSTLARELLSIDPNGLILSTDDYFAQRNGYDPGLLGAAHEWNQSRAKDAMRDSRSPIIVDNTNIQAWEMKPYVQMALEKGYRVDFCAPDTSWKFDPYELEKRNKHGVTHEKIAQMMHRFSIPISVDIVMSSQEPEHLDQRRRPDQPRMTRSNRDFH